MSRSKTEQEQYDIIVDNSVLEYIGSEDSPEIEELRKLLHSVINRAIEVHGQYRAHMMKKMMEQWRVENLMVK